MSETYDQETAAMARNRKGSNRLLELLAQHHPEHAPKGFSMPVQPVNESPPNAEVMALIERLTSKVTDLEKRLEFVSGEVGKVIGNELDDPSATPRMTEIVKAICDFYGVSKHDLLGPRRTGPVMIPRQVGYYLARELTGMSFPQIGRHFGGKDHTSALHGANKIRDLIESDSIVRDDIDVLKIKIGEKVMNRRFSNGQSPS